VLLHGQRIGYRAEGSGSVLVLLHGIAGTSATWDDLIPRLSARHRVLAPDLLGHGESAKPDGDYSLGAYANMLRDFLEVLGHERATLVKHSLKNDIALQFAYQFPEKCERLVLVSSGGLGREVHPLLRAAALPGAEVVLPWLSVAARQSVGRVVHALGSLGLRASADLEESWRSFVSLEEPDARRAFLHTVRGIIDLHGQRVSAHDRLYLAAELPTLILWGERDRLIPVRHGREAHERIPGSRLEVFPGAGHFSWRDEPRRFAEVLLDFMKTTTPLPFDKRRLRGRLREGTRAGPAA